MPSYAPTIRALASARAKAAAAEGAIGTALVVAVPDAGDVRKLVGVTSDAAVVRDLLPGVVVLPASGEKVGRDEVMAALKTSEIAHFACHAVADIADPGQSSLILHDYRDRPLTVTSIARLDLPNAALAYLSSCSTTETTPRHADEMTHLTAAFHVAGYRSVVGTLWPVNDAIASVLAEEFYTLLSVSGTTTPNHHAAARTLRQVVRGLRDDDPDLPALWSSHTHTGV